MIIMRKKITALFVAITMLAGFLPDFSLKVEAYTVKKSSTTSYEGEMNALTKEQYSEFGLTNSPEQVNPEDTSHPYEEYTPIEISELYIGQMNRSSKWSGSFKVAENTDETSKNALNLDTMDDNSLIGNDVSFKNFYRIKMKKKYKHIMLV